MPHELRSDPRPPAVPGATIYALECSRRLGLGDAGAVRLGLAPYSDDTDVDRLITALDAVAGAARLTG